jgi:tRNA threonylcarbamoyladenosine biosynthesis protein TsaE
MMSFYRDLRDEAATRRAGLELGRLARPGMVVALIGPLGAGKTAFTRAMAQGLEVEDLNAVSSPTFTLVQVYQGRLTMHHCDTYRLKHPAEFDDLGASEWLGTDGVCVIEWADRVAHLLPNDLLVVVLEPADEGQRRMRVRATGPFHAETAEEWARVKL